MTAPSLPWPALVLLSFLACSSAQAPLRDAGPCANVADGTECATGLCCGGVCATFESDSNNCGACGLVCPDGEQCAQGVCLTCASLNDGTACQGDTFVGGACCGGTCLNAQSDVNNCGGCGNICPLAQNCVDAGCVPQCVNQPDNTSCSLVVQSDGLCCGQICIDPTSDNSNCKLCGNACTSGNTCRSGVCL